MANMAVFKKTRREQVHDRLLSLILSPERAVGAQLAPIKELAERFETSARTVHSALCELEKKGYVVLKHGDGTYVASQHRAMTMNDTVAVCMEAHAHLFGELACLLTQELSARHKVPLAVDIASGARNQLIARISHTDAACFIVHPTESFGPADIQKTLRHKPVVAVLRWDSSIRWPGLSLVLTDMAEGGNIVARHLHAAGHRRVLLLGTGTTAAQILDTGSVRYASPAGSFVETWAALGGEWLMIEGKPDMPTPTGYAFDEARLLAPFQEESPPTAVFAAMDALAWEAQRLIHKHLPHLQDKVEVVGYYDTPWSRAGNPPFSTVSLDLPRVVSETMRIMEQVETGGEPDPAEVKVAPRLVVR
jgi:DNA-binding LacI/PurR family transcriptional regulator